MVRLIPQALLLSLPFGTLAVSVSKQISHCKSVHMILARGTDNSPKADALDNIAHMVQAKLGSETSDYVELHYPASEGQGGQPSYPASIQDGQNALRDDIKDYASKCGHSKIVLIGYSQGAQVIGNVLCGATNEGLGITPTQPLVSTYHHAIFASVWLGDPAHNPNQPWNVGGGSNGTHGVGAYSRDNSYDCDYMTGKLASFCSQGDKYCDSQGAVPPGQDPQTIHDEEIATWTSKAAHFIIPLVA